MNFSNLEDDQNDQINVSKIEFIKESLQIFKTTKLKKKIKKRFKEKKSMLQTFILKYFS